MTTWTEGAWIQAWGAALVHFVWQGTLAAVILWAALWAMRRRPAAWRYVASCATLALLVALPPATAWILARRAAAPVAAAGAAPVQFLASATASATGPAAVSWMIRLEAWALPIWSLGVLILSLRLVWGARQVRLLRRRAEPAGEGLRETVERLARRMGIRRVVGIGFSPRAESPAVVGWLRPLILLPPATLLGLTAEQLEAVLAHELAHIRRFDYVVNLAQTLIETLLFYHPAVWWISARIRHERELCCDDLAVASCGDALCYARALTRLERLRLSAPEMAMASTGGPLLYRIQRLMGTAGPRYRTSRLPAIVTLCLGLACLGWNVRWAKAQDQQKPPQQELPKVTITHDGKNYTVSLDNSGTKKPGEPAPDAIEMTADPGRTATVYFQGQEGAFAFRPDSERNRGVQIDTAGAKVVKSEPVEYPGSAIERNIQGVVTVEAILDASGEVSDAHVLAGPQELRKAALRSVLVWRFQPDPAGAGAARQVNITFQIPPGGFPKEPEEQRLLLRGPNVGWARERTAEQAEQTQKLLEEELAALKQRNQGTLPEGSSPELEKQYAELVQRLQASREASALDERRLLENKQQQDSAQAVLGRTVESIRFRGMAELSQSKLLGQIPVHIGDVITADSLNALETAVRQFNERFVIGYALGEGNQVGIRIVGSEEGRVNVRK